MSFGESFLCRQAATYTEAAQILRRLSIVPVYIRVPLALMSSSAFMSAISSVGGVVVATQCGGRVRGSAIRRAWHSVWCLATLRFPRALSGPFTLFVINRLVEEKKENKENRALRWWILLMER
eukprot:EC785880.1.p2 GENE.EC785880.1~~EC785880.1.p2  ORF type:complete len:123 (+),score=14.73 EC785880.1:46-414(+)